MQPIRIYDMPPCRMVASPVGMFGEPALDVFSAWMETQPRSLFPRDFLKENGLMIDPDRRELGNIITSAAVQAVLGYEQMDYYYPVRPAR